MSGIFRNFLPWELPQRPLEDITFWLIVLTSTVSPEDIRSVINLRYRLPQHLTIHHIQETIRWLARGDNDYLAWVLSISQRETDRRRKATVKDVERAKR